MGPENIHWELRVQSISIANAVQAATFTIGFDTLLLGASQKKRNVLNAKTESTMIFTMFKSILQEGPIIGHGASIEIKT